MHPLRRFRLAATFLLTVHGILAVCSPPSRAAVRTWEPAPNLGGPTLGGVALAIDPARRHLYRFGGTEDGVPSNRLFRCALVPPDQPWELVSEGPDSSPAATPHAHFDRLGDRIVVLAGTEVWAWGVTSETWTPLAPSGVGPADVVSTRALVHDSRRNRLLYLDTAYPDTLPRVRALSLDGAPAWSELATSGAPGLTGATFAAYDSLGDRLFVIGAFTQPLYALDLTSGSWSVAIASPPQALQWETVALAWESGPNRLLLARFVAPHPHFGGVRFLTVDLSAPSLAWTEPPMTGAPPIGNHLPTVYDPGGRNLIVLERRIGLLETMRVLGEFGTGPRFFVWTSFDFGRWPGRAGAVANALDVRGRHWYVRDDLDLQRIDVDRLESFESVSTVGYPPTARFGEGAVWDPVGSRLLFCGGDDGTSLGGGDVHELALDESPPRWTRLVASDVRVGPAVAYDPAGHVLFASFESGIRRLDLDDASPAWESFVELPFPPEAIAFDPAGPRLLVGSTTAAAAVTLEPTVTIEPVVRTFDAIAGAAFAFDPIRRRLLVHNGARWIGATYFSRIVTDAFGTGGSSALMDPMSDGEANTPPRFSIGAYDPVLDRMLLLNGIRAEDALDNRLWRGIWTLADDATTPTRLDLVEADAEISGEAGPAIRVRFAGEGVAGSVHVERTFAEREDWLEVGLALEILPGRFELRDASALPGAVYRYRGRWRSDEGVEGMTPASAPVSLPNSPVGAPRLALRAREGSVVRAWPTEFECALVPGAGDAMLELVDVRGRVLARDVVRTAGAFACVPSRPPGPGLYFARLRQGVHSAVVRLVCL